MKKLFVTLCFTGIAVGAFAQATVPFLNQSGAAKNPIYDVDKSDATLQTLNTANRDLLPKAAAGSTLTAELWYGPDADHLKAAPNSQITTWAAAGVFKGNPTFGVDSAAGGTTSIQIRVWDNKGGTITSWADVWKAGNEGVARGSSAVISGINLAGGANPPTAPADFLAKFTSFGLYTLPVIPEPSLIALGALGLGALVIRRRK